MTTFHDPIEVPYGYCHCGCGEKTKAAAYNNVAHGHVKGEPHRFIYGHSSRCRKGNGPDYLVDENGCWVWQRNVHPQGYGHCTKNVYGDRFAHRAFYIKFKGPIPDGLELDHLCRNRLCVNPDHLEAVTHAENAQRGAKAKLTAEAVIEFRRQYANRSGTHTAFAREKAVELGVAWQTIDGALRGYGWTNLEEDTEEFDRAA